jgi:hypothetical protein
MSPETGSCAALKYKTLDLRSSGVLSGVDWLLVTDFSGQHLGPLFKGQSVQKQEPTDRLSRNVSKHVSIYAA